MQHQHPPATRVATPKIGVDNQGRVWYKIDESKPLPVLARGCSHFLYLKTATIVSLAIRIKSTDVQFDFLLSEIKDYSAGIVFYLP